jgi:hypothetical protein
MGEGLAPAVASQPRFLSAIIGRVGDTILQECGFLRIQDWIFREGRMAQLYDGILMVLVAGLPWAKSNAWIMPLRLAVASVLQSRGFPAKVLRNKLYLTDEATDFHMRVDFLAASPRGRARGAQPSRAPPGTALMTVLAFEDPRGRSDHAEPR